jgi:hypothetical protein
MNKHKTNERGFSFLEIVILSVAAVILMTAGVGHAWLKNSQVETVREMDRTQRRINDQEDVINSLQVKIDKKLNIYQLRDNLEKSGSQLVMLPVSAIVKIPAHPINVRVDAVAAAPNENTNSAIAQRSP